MNIPLSPYVPEKLVSRYGFSRPVPRQPAHVHTHQAESGAYLRDSSRVPRRRPFMKPPYAIGSVPSLSGQHAIAFRWCSLPRVRRHRASQPQGSSERVLPLQVTMDQLICASLSHTHYWCEVGMLKVPAVCMCVWVVCNYQVGTTYQKKMYKHTYVRTRSWMPVRTVVPALFCSCPLFRPNLVSRDGERGILIFPVQLTTSRIGNLTRLIHTLLYYM